jgi:ABC-type hemin transport system substrate-binding protein
MSHEFDLEAIRAKAKELGVAYHPAQKAETIQFNIDQFLEANAPTIIQPPVKDETPA